MTFDAELFLFNTTLFQQEIQPAIAQTLAGHGYPALLDGYAQGIYEMQRCMDPNNPIDHADLAPAIFASAVFDTCIDKRRAQFMGERTQADELAQILKRQFGVADDHRSIELLELLDQRALHPGSERYINGWLDTHETAQLAEILAELPLPEYPPSFEVMQALYETACENTEYPIQPTWSYVQVSFLKTITTIAYKQECGLLWAIGFNIIWNVEQFTHRKPLIDATTALKDWCRTLLTRSFIK